MRIVLVDFVQELFTRNQKNARLQACHDMNEANSIFISTIITNHELWFHRYGLDTKQ